jgi:hypothetical protein
MRRRPCLKMPSIVDDVAEVITITTIFSLSMVLSYPPTRIIVIRRLLLLAEDVASLQTCFSRSFDRLLWEGSPRRFLVDGSTTMMLPAASTPCWAKGD